MPGVLDRNLNIVILSIKVIFMFYNFPYGRILMFFIWYLGSLNIANSHTQH